MSSTQPPPVRENRGGVRGRHITIACIASLILSSVLLGNLLAGAGASFPSWTEIGIEKSELEERSLASAPVPSTESLADGTLQSGMEKYLSDHVPLRSSLILSYAKLHLADIRMANLACGYSCYPTYLGSKYCVSEQEDMLFAIPSRSTKEARQSMRDKAGEYNSFFSKHPDVSFSVYVVANSNYLTASPPARMSMDPVDLSVVDQEFCRHLEGARYIVPGISPEEYRRWYFATDHHWNIDGAYEAYVRCANSLGFDDVVAKGRRIEYGDVRFLGSYARRSRHTGISDGLWDYDFDLGALQVSYDGQDGSGEDITHRSLYGNGEQLKTRFVNHYAKYFHGNFGELVVTGTDPQSDRTLLIVGDSYTNCIERLFTRHYAKVIAYDPRYSDQSLSEVMARHDDIDDCLFMMRAGGLIGDDGAKALK